MNLRRDVFQAIADPTRRGILLLVASQAMTAGAIASNFDTARPTVSKHLQILTECELLKQEQNGREIYYHLNPRKIKEIADFIEPFRQMWDDRFNKLETIMKNYNPDGPDSYRDQEKK
jgi:DNA-binding transcriptional ArsR family regulator